MMQEFPTLVLKAQTYTYPDGRSATLLMVEGTLPMYYQVREVMQQDSPVKACTCNSFYISSDFLSIRLQGKVA